MSVITKIFSETIFLSSAALVIIIIITLFATAEVVAVGKSEKLEETNKYEYDGSPRIRRRVVQYDEEVPSGWSHAEPNSLVAIIAEERARQKRDIVRTTERFDFARWNEWFQTWSEWNDRNDRTLNFNWSPTMKSNPWNHWQNWTPMWSGWQTTTRWVDRRTSKHWAEWGDATEAKALSVGSIIGIVCSCVVPLICCCCCCGIYCAKKSNTNASNVQHITTHHTTSQGGSEIATTQLGGHLPSSGQTYAPGTYPYQAGMSGPPASQPWVEPTAPPPDGSALATAPPSYLQAVDDPQYLPSAHSDETAGSQVRVTLLPTYAEYIQGNTPVGSTENIHSAPDTQATP